VSSQGGEEMAFYFAGHLRLHKVSHCAPLGVTPLYPGTIHLSFKGYLTSLTHCMSFPGEPYTPSHENGPDCLLTGGLEIAQEGAARLRDFRLKLGLLRPSRSFIRSSLLEVNPRLTCPMGRTYIAVHHHLVTGICTS
jgi:hypothetical protein